MPNRDNEKMKKERIGCSDFSVFAQQQKESTKMSKICTKIYYQAASPRLSAQPALLSALLWWEPGGLFLAAWRPKEGQEPGTRF